MNAPVLTVVDVMRRAQGYLAERGVTSPRLDAELLLADVLDCDRLSLYTGFDRPLTQDETDRYRQHIARRAKREPVAYIVGTRGFRNVLLAVGPDVLIPRPETELLVEWVVADAPPSSRVLDWGTGSGAIAIAIAGERPDLSVVGIDRSQEALDVARANDAENRVEWHLSDGFLGMDDRVFDVVVANPPYVARDEFDSLAPEVRYEPHGALVAGETGLETFETLIPEAARHLVDAGLLLVEIGADQGQAVTAMFAAAGFRDVEVRVDLAGLDRAVGGKR